MNTDPDSDPAPDPDADPDPAKSCRSDRIRIYKTDGTQYLKHVWDSASAQTVVHSKFFSLVIIGNRSKISRALHPRQSLERKEKYDS
jgi:hypothetical protein